ncbi:hypothetical protein BN1723_003258, partial [Verticillium longisporum]
MDEIAKEYDVIVLGTGLTECILSGVLSVKGKKVLHIDRNDHYGGEAASVNLETLFKKHGNYQKGEEPWTKYGRLNDWNIDLVPKFLMSSGELTNILISTDVTRYLEFKQVAGSYVQQGQGSKATVAKVPSDAAEALRSPLMGIFEKRRMKSFIEWVGTFDLKNPSSSHKGLDLNTATMKEVYDKFSLETGTRDFIGHAMALYTDDDYLTTPGAAPEAIERIRLYGNSVARYGKSPYIYPLIATANAERIRARMGFGEHEANERDQVVQQTMQGIKHVLTERYYLWEDARELAKNDPEIDLSGNGEAYQPSYERGEDHLVAEPSEATLEEATRKTDAAASTANVEGVQIDPSTLPAGDKAPVQSQKL